MRCDASEFSFISDLSLPLSFCQGKGFGVFDTWCLVTRYIGIEFWALNLETFRLDNPCWSLTDSLVRYRGGLNKKLDGTCAFRCL